MLDLDAWREIFDSLKRHKLRTLLTAFGVFWGIFMLMLLLGVGKGLENGVYSQFGNVTTNGLFIWGNRTTLPYKGLNPGRWIRLTNADLEAIKDGVEGIDRLNAAKGLWGEFTIYYGRKSGSFRVEGDLPDVRFIEPRFIVQGRFLNESDISLKRKTAVIGRGVKEALFGNDDPVGEFLSIRGVYFQIVGVFDVQKIGSQGQDRTALIHIPLTTLQRAFNQGEYVDSITLSAAAGFSAAALQSKAKELLKARHSVAPADDQAIGSWNTEEEFKTFQGLFRGINAFMWIVGIGTLVAGMVGVSNIMLIIVKERTREIGIRKALGATPASIIAMVLQESIFLTAVSGYAGLVSGVGVIELAAYLMAKFQIKSEYFLNPEINIGVAATATVLLVLIGAAAGFIPARQAATINPIEALRSE
jgi:putative ABC transport system permease protein